MLAAVCRSFSEPLILEELELRPPRAGEVEIRIEACAICHSDIHFIEGAWGGTLPAVYGHEAVGRIVGVGEAVVGHSVGDRVLATLLRSCGGCANCRSGRLSRCEHDFDSAPGPLSSADGTPVFQGLRTAAFAERVVVEQSQIAHVPDSIPPASACLLSCGVITGIGAAVNTARIEPGSSVAVIGVGGVGLNAVQGARICGASRIIAVDISDGKLADAREFGATDTVSAASEKPHRSIRAIAGGRGVDYALVAVGSTKAYELGIRSLARGGSLVMVGMPAAGEKVAFEPLASAFLSQSMLGSYMGDALLGRDIPYLVDLYGQGRLKLDELVTSTYAFADINEAIKDTASGAVRRNVIVFD